jgi:hypothetical protein
MRQWKTEVQSRGRDNVSTSYQTFNLLKARGLVTQWRAREEAEGKPKRKLSPITWYVLEELIWQFFREKDKAGDTLEKIIIKDTKANGF